MDGPLALASRVMLYVAPALAMCLVMIAVLASASIERHFEAQDAEELQVVADSVQRVLGAHVRDSDALIRGLSHAVSGHHGIYFSVARTGGGMFYSNGGPDMTPLLHNAKPASSVDVGRLHVWRDGEHMYRGAVLEAHPETPEFTIATAIDMGFHSRFMERFDRAAWGIMGCVGVLTMVAAWLGVRHGLAPLHALSMDIRAIRADLLQTRLDPARVPRELSELVESFNEMLREIESGYLRLTNFSAEIAHELRTPLTNMITQTQVAVGTMRDAREYRDLLYSNLEEQERLARMVSDMLLIAQAEHGLMQPSTEAMDAFTEIHAVLAYIDALAEERGISFSVLGSTASIRADRSMLRRALSNLLSNAVRHSSDGSVVSVGVSQPLEGRVRIDVVNSGATIPAEQLPHLFERFYRGDSSERRRREGTGLGLAIVRGIIEAQDGNVAVESRDGVTTFSIWLPAT